MAVKMVPTVGVVVIRDGNRVKPKIGESFDFTAEERDAIEAAQPGSLRKPVNEDKESTATAAPSAEAAQSKARGGKKAATAAQADSEVESTDVPEGEGGGPGAGTDDDL